MKSLDFDDEPLPKVTCKSTKCEEDLHCFRPKKKVKPEVLTGGNCHACDVELVDWQIMHARDIRDVIRVFQLMRKEYIREFFWTIPLDEKLKRSLASKGKNRLMVDVDIRLKRSVLLAGRSIYRDGTQTPTKEANIIYYAQHATATCCRKCIKYWHGIPYERDLTEEELLYFRQLISNYIDMRLPGLPEQGEQLTLSFTD